MEEPGNSIISKVTGDDSFSFLSFLARSGSSGGDGFDLNDVKGLQRS